MMQKAGIWAVVVLGLVVIATAAPAEAEAGKFAVILQAGTKSEDGAARAKHFFLYARELHEKGHEVVAIFDGAGTLWAEELSKEDSNSFLKKDYEAFKQKGIVEIICDYCAGAFEVKEPLQERGANLVGDYEGHPSVVKWVEQGYQLIIL